MVAGGSWPCIHVVVDFRTSVQTRLRKWTPSGDGSGLLSGVLNLAGCRAEISERPSERRRSARVRIRTMTSRMIMVTSRTTGGPPAPYQAFRKAAVKTFCFKAFAAFSSLLDDMSYRCLHAASSSRSHQSALRPARGPVRRGQDGWRKDPLALPLRLRNVSRCSRKRPHQRARKKLRLLSERDCVQNREGELAA